jgi:hypothetical protein
MPGFIATILNPAMCIHGGQGKPMPPVCRVQVLMQPVVTASHTYLIAGCGLTGTGSPFCASAKVLVGALRVKVQMAPGLPPTPVAVAPGKGECIPTLNPLILPPAGQPRVFAQ